MGQVDSTQVHLMTKEQLLLAVYALSQHLADMVSQVAVEPAPAEVDSARLIARLIVEIANKDGIEVRPS